MEREHQDLRRMRDFRDIPICETWAEFRQYLPCVLMNAEFSCMEGYRYYFDLWIWTNDRRKKGYLRMARFFERAAKEARALDETVEEGIKKYRALMAAREIERGKRQTLIVDQASIEKLVQAARDVNTEANSGDTSDGSTSLPGKPVHE